MTELTKRQKEIVSTSIKIIATKGVQNLTIKNISGEIGISEAAIYRHFKSKVDILLAILSDFRISSSLTTKKAMSLLSSPLDQLGLIFSIHFSNFSTNHSLASVIFAEEIFQDDEQLAKKVQDIMQENQKIITQIIKKGQKQSEIRDDISIDDLSTITMGALRLQVKKWKMSQCSFDLNKKGDELWKTIRKMIAQNDTKNKNKSKLINSQLFLYYRAI